MEEIDASKRPAFKLYPKDFLTDTRVVMMTDAQLGCYFRFLCYLWIEKGQIPADDNVLRTLSGCNEEDIPIIKNCLYVDDGFFKQKRMQQEIAEWDGYRDKKVHAANMRWEKERAAKAEREVKKTAKANTPPDTPPNTDNPMKKSRQNFIAAIVAYREKNPNKYPDTMYHEFSDYWNIPENKATPKKMVWQNEKSWNLAGRLSTWNKVPKLSQNKAFKGKQNEEPVREKTPTSNISYE